MDIPATVSPPKHLTRMPVAVRWPELEKNYFPVMVTEMSKSVEIREKFAETASFFRQFLRRSGSVGALCPSSPYLAELITSEGKISEAGTVVEIGAGSGAFTGKILSAVRKSARVVIVENNPQFTAILRRKFPHANIVEDCATQLGRHLPAYSSGPACSVISGLPWASLPASLRGQLLKTIHANLAPGGTFVTFAYLGPNLLPTGRAFRRQLGQTFSHVGMSRVEFRNLPPAFVYRATR